MKEDIVYIEVTKFKPIGSSNLIIFEIKHGGDSIMIYKDDKDSITGFFITACSNAKEVKIDYNEKKATEERVIRNMRCTLIVQSVTEEDIEYFSKRLSKVRNE